MKILTELCLREVAEGYEAKRTREDCDGAGSSNDKPHPKRIARLLEMRNERIGKTKNYIELT